MNDCWGLAGYMGEGCFMTISRYFGVTYKWKYFIPFYVYFIEGQFKKKTCYCLFHSNQHRRPACIYW